MKRLNLKSKYTLLALFYAVLLITFGLFIHNPDWENYWIIYIPFYGTTSLIFVLFIKDIFKNKGLVVKLRVLAKWAVITVFLGTGLWLFTNWIDSLPKNYYPDDYPNDYPYSCSYIEEQKTLNFCASIEDRAKVEVAQMQETIDLVKQYGPDKVIVSVLSYEYISDKNYLKRLFSDSYDNVNCIVFVDWPDGQRIYIETGHEMYDLITPDQLAGIIKDVSAEDKQALYDNLH